MDKRGADQRNLDQARDDRNQARDDRAQKAVTDQAIQMLENVQEQMLVEVGHVREAIRILRNGRPGPSEGDGSNDQT